MGVIFINGVVVDLSIRSSQAWKINFLIFKIWTSKFDFGFAVYFYLLVLTFLFFFLMFEKLLMDEIVIEF